LDVVMTFAGLAVASFIGATAARPKWVAPLFGLTVLFIVGVGLSWWLIPSEPLATVPIASATAPVASGPPLLSQDDHIAPPASAAASARPSAPPRRPRRPAETPQSAPDADAAASAPPPSAPVAAVTPAPAGSQPPTQTINAPDNTGIVTQDQTGDNKIQK